MLLLLWAASAAAAMLVFTVRTGVDDDFQALHDSAVAWRAGQPLYPTYGGSRPPNLNPPLVVLAMAPLAWLSTPVAYAVWTALTLLAAWGCWRRWTVAVPRHGALLFAIFAASNAGYGALRFGSLTWPLAYAMTVAWQAGRRGDARLAGGVVGACLATKLFLGLWPLYWLWRRSWSAFAWCCGAFLALTTPAILGTGLQGTLDWVALLRQVSWQDYPLNVSILGFFQRIGTETPAPWQPLLALSAGTITASWLLISVGIVTVLARRLGDDIDRSWGALGLGALLIAPTGWLYYLPLFGGPLASLWAEKRSRLAAGVVLWLSPTALVVWGQPNGWLALSVGSLYMWGTWITFHSVLSSPIESGPTIAEPNGKGIEYEPLD